MRLDFNILWVDDQPTGVSSLIKAIKDRMEDQGFEFKPILCTAIEEVRRCIATDVFTDEVDLILVDWDLGGGVQGQDAILAIREVIQYRDIVFYSALTPPDKLRQLAFNSGVEGLYCVSREDLVDEVFGVFDSLVKKVLDLDHTRGIVMGATSDIDYMVNECLVSIHEQLDTTGRQAMLKDALSLVEEHIKESTEHATKLRSTTAMSDLFRAYSVFTAYDRLRVLSRQLKTKAFKAHASLRPSVVTYMDKVVPHRNILGHQVLVPEGKAKAVTDNKGREIGITEARELRCLILKLRSDFRSLLAALQAGS
jgi:hypothetical protein